MKVSEIISRLDNGDKVTHIANEFGVSRKTVTERLKRVGYLYNRNTKKYEFSSDLNTKEKVDKQDFVEIGRVKKPVKNNNEVREKSDKNNKKEIKREEPPFTQEEIDFLKKLCHKEHKNLHLYFDLSLLPPKEQTKKHSLEISKTTWDEFDAFSENWKNKRISKNDLIEIAIRRLMMEEGTE